VAGENLEIVKEIWARFPHEGVEGVLGFFHDDFSWRLEDGAVVEGHDGLRTYFGELAAQGVKVNVSAYDFEENGARVLVPASIRFKTDVSIADNQSWLVYELRDGKVARAVSYGRANEASEAMAG
jgi:ketosteroid isomerase-like protein